MSLADAKPALITSRDALITAVAHAREQDWIALNTEFVRESSYYPSLSLVQIAVADQIYLSEHAWARLPFASLGISAELASTFMLPRLLGMQKAKELLFYSDRIEARELLKLGIANAVVPHDELLSFTREKALQLIPPRGAGASIRAMKRIVHKQRLEEVTVALDLENEVLNELMKSEDFAEGLMARIEKRAPVFKGR